MPNPYFQFKQFTVYHDRCAMKVTTDACLFGAWCADDSQRSTVNSQLLLDIGTGTGLLSLMVAQQNKVLIDAVEIDPEAAAQATENVKASAFAKAITVYHSDIAIWEKGGYDIIISNPPFYENEIPAAQQQKNVAHHSEGLRLETLFTIIQEKLTPQGVFYLLLPYKRKETIERLLQRNGLFIEKEMIVHPVTTHAPFRLLLKGRKQPVKRSIETIAVYNADKQYTAAFIDLLKDYYLYL